MKTEEFFRSLARFPVIAGLREPDQELPRAIRSGVRALVVLGDDIFALGRTVREAHAGGLLVLAHVDLVKGIGRDEAGIRFLAKGVGVDGVVTTRTALVAAAKKEGLIAVLRLFVLDSESLETGLAAVDKARPDAIELLPGLVVPLIADQLEAASLPPLIAGGLIRTPEQVRAILAAGAVAVSTSTEALWADRGRAA